MSNRFEGKIAVITGAASGIGRETARLLAKEGARLVLGDLNESAGNALADELGKEIGIFCRTDVARYEDVERLIQTAVATFGGLDILFNNAGIGSELVKTPELGLETWHKVIAVDLHSVFYGCKLAIPEMRRRGGGAIVNTASISGLGGDCGFNAYNAAKGAVVNFTRTLALDHADENIRVNALCPGFIDTPLTAVAESLGIHDTWTEQIPMKRAGKPEEMAKVVAFLASDDASYITGGIIVADGGVTAATGQLNLYKTINAAPATPSA